MNDLLSTLLSTIRLQYTRFLNRFRTLTSKSFLQNKVWTQIKVFFASLFDIKPKNKHDYYHVFGWLVSKRLAYVIVIVMGVFSLTYLWGNKENIFNNSKGAGIRTYEYNDILLRYAKGKVRIKAKSGYMAYEGEVNKGSVTGEGSLYGIKDNLIYQGSFVKNKYEGEGTLYYPDGTLEYQGAFVNNLFEGNGTQYRVNGTKLYEGSFIGGLKEGEGVLFDSGENSVFSGSFSHDDIKYETFLGKSTKEIADMYTGARSIYEGGDSFEVYMPDINAIYTGKSNTNSLDDDVLVEAIYILKNSLATVNGELESANELNVYFGEPIYEGYSYISQTEALAQSFVRASSGDYYYKDSKLKLSYIYDDYVTIEDYDQDSLVYLYSYMKDNIIYTFVCKDKEQPFGFYYLEKTIDSSNTGENEIDKEAQTE